MAVHFEVDGAVAIITLDRPEALNALDVTLLQSSRQYLTTVRDDDSIHVAIITGQDCKAFCVGADLKSTLVSDATFPEAISKSLDRSSLMGLFVRLVDLTDLNLYKPLIAAVNAHCLGGGLELVLQCDTRIASSTTTFTLPEVRVGSIPAVSGLQRLLKAVTSAYAMQMALTCDRVTALAALASGLVTDVCEPGELMPRALALARRIAENAPLAVQAIKRLARQSGHLGEIDAQALTEMYWGVLRETEDRAEGRKAFAEKRPPVYRGR